MNKPEPMDLEDWNKKPRAKKRRPPSMTPEERMEWGLAEFKLRREAVAAATCEADLVAAQTAAFARRRAVGLAPSDARSLIGFNGRRVVVKERRARTTAGRKTACLAAARWFEQRDEPEKAWKWRTWAEDPDSVKDIDVFIGKRAARMAR